MATQRFRPRVGDESWFVEWCYQLTFDEYGDVDPANCMMRTRRAATEEDAARLAKEVYPQTTETFGYVSYWPATFTAYDEGDAIRYPHAGYWETTADAKYYEGED